MAEVRRASIGRRLATAVFLTSGLALALTCLAFVVYDVLSLRAATLRSAETLAQVIGLNTADALAFEDPAAAGLILQSLSAAPEITAAVVYDDEGAPFARYQRGGAAPLPDGGAAPPVGHDFGLRHLDLVRPLEQEGVTLGTIRLRWDTRALLQRVQLDVGIVAVLLAVVYGVSRWIARRLRDAVATPLAALAEGARAISEGKLSTQVPVSGDHEIAALGAAFNAMASGLRELVAQVGESIAAVQETAAALEQGSQAMSDEVRRQEEAVREGSRSVEQVTRSIQEVNANVRHLADRARDTFASIVEMDSSITSVDASMDRLAVSIESGSSATLEMATSVREIASAMESLDDASNETAARLRQLAESVRGVERKASESGELSREARDEAARGQLAVEETVAAMQDIRGNFNTVQASVRMLVEKSESIGKILGVIEDIVDQTNLLALNAAIIAAQAGDQGRAFAVVAEQVKELAEGTAASTREIAAVVENVQRETRATIAAMEAGDASVEKGVARSREAGEVLKAIMEKSERTARHVAEIAQAAAQQAAGIRDVESAMAQVRQLVEHTNNATHEQEKVGNAMTEIVERIRELGQDVKRATGQQSSQSRRITSAVEDVATGVNQILAASQAQAQESEQIQHALGVFSEVAAETAGRTRAFHEIVQRLGERSAALQRALERFQA